MSAAEVDDDDDAVESTADTVVLASDDEVMRNANAFMETAGAKIATLEREFITSLTLDETPIVWREEHTNVVLASPHELRRRAVALDCQSDASSLLPSLGSSVLRFACVGPLTFGTRAEPALVRVLVTGQIIVSPRATAADLIAFVLAAVHTRRHNAPRIYETFRFLRLFLDDYVDTIDEDAVAADEDAAVVDECHFTGDCVFSCLTMRHFRHAAMHGDAAFARAPRGALTRLVAGRYGAREAPNQFIVLDDGTLVVAAQCAENDIVAFVLACVRVEERHRGVASTSTATRHLIRYIDDDDIALRELGVIEDGSVECALEWRRVVA